MFIRSEKRGFTEESQSDLLIVTMEEGASEHSLGAISHTIGSYAVVIRSNQPSWGSVPIEGREELRLLRDTLTKICEMEGIE